jgi:cytochrome c oxidase assembly factor 6
MGLLSLFSSSQPAPEEQRANEVRSGAVAPSRSERAKCWAARDAYFACLDANSIIDSVAEDGKARKACGPQSAAFEQDCAAQWVGNLLPEVPDGL